MCFLGRIHWVLASRIESHCFALSASHHSTAPHCVDAPDQDPFLPELALGIVLGADLEEEVHELLQWLRLAGHDESNNVHEKAGLRVSIEHNGEDPFLCGCQTTDSSKAGQSP